MSRESSTKISGFFVFSAIIAIMEDISASDIKANLQTASPETETNTSNYFGSKESNHSKHKKPPKISVTTLPEIVQEALKYSPRIEADKEALGATDDAIDQATAGYMPSVDLRVSLGRENTRRQLNATPLTPQPSIGAISATRSDPSITIRQILFDGMATASRVARARSQQHQAHGTLGMTIDTAMIEAASATIDLRRLQRLLRLVDNNIRFHQVMKMKIEEIVQAGAAPLSDLFQVDSRLQDTLVSKANILSDLEVARAKFVEVIGKEPPDTIQRIKLPGYLTSMSAEMAVRMALDNNHSLKVAKSNVQIAEANHQEAASKLVPTITFELEGERDRNMSATSGSQSRLTAMVVARHNLFNGGADFAKSRETTKRMAEAHARLTLARRQTERTIRAAWGEAKNAQAKSAHLTNLIREKRRIRNAYVEEFSVGKRTLTDILDAANDVFLTEASRTTTDATADISTVTLSVGTAQFKGYLNRAHDHEAEEDEKTATDLDLSPYALNLEPPPLSLASYPASQPTPLKTRNASKAPNAPLKRKSIFDVRKESREKDLLEKSST